MKMNWKKALLLIFFFLAGVIVGTAVAKGASYVGFLSWLGWGSNIGVGYPNPVVLDLAVIKLQFGFSVDISLAKILCVIISLIIYNRFSKGF